ncbi:phage portal protein [Mycoplasmopsis felis]|uniref:phage portal protein n=1 Tax=Mycoplasmopsis felis TaxID=33923 RepID=UPI002AFE2E2D|nr:phage portal protein [Mycoplasmopsis felis]WQQ10439.1 phage portal protein [Mycoplasmopsis felis]
MGNFLKSIKNIFSPKNENDNPELGYRDFSIPLNSPMLSNTIRTLTPAEFLTFGVCARAIQLIANDIARVNFRHTIQTEDGEVQNIYNSDILQILNKRPNDKQTPWEFKKIIIWNLIIYGVAPLLKIRDENKKIIELLPVFPPFITKHTEENNKTIYKFKRLDNDPVVFYEDEVIWIDYEVIPGFENVSTRSLFKSTISKIKENELSMLNAITNDLSASIFIKIKDATNKQQRELANEALKGMIENQKKSGSFGIVIDDKWDIGKAADIVNTRIDFQTRNSLGREFAASLGIPPAKLGIDDPNKYNSSSELNRAYVDNALKPLLINITQRISESILKNEPNQEITFRTLDLLSLDLKSIQEFAASAINSGYATINEIRALIGLDKHKDGDSLLANGTLTPVNVLKNNLITKKRSKNDK